MKKEEVEEKVKGIVLESLMVPEDNITPSANFKEDLGADSMDMFEILMEVEKEFHVVIPDDQTEQIITVEDLSNHICEILPMEE